MWWKVVGSRSHPAPCFFYLGWFSLFFFLFCFSGLSVLPNNKHRCKNSRKIINIANFSLFVVSFFLFLYHHQLIFSVITSQLSSLEPRYKLNGFQVSLSQAMWKHAKHSSSTHALKEFFASTNKWGNNPEYENHAQGPNPKPHFRVMAYFHIYCLK